MAKIQQIVGFRVGKENFGVPIDIVHEIVPMMEITAVPDSPTYIEGVINLRGKIIPVVDSANEVLKINPELIEPPPNIFEQGELNYVTGVGKLNGKLVILIDLAKIMQRGELRRLSDFAETADPIPQSN